MDTELQFDVKRFDGTTEKLTESHLRSRVREGGLVFEIMDHTGDTKKIWDPSKPIEVEDAQRSFDHFTSKGYKAFRTNDKGRSGRSDEVVRLPGGSRRLRPADGRGLIRAGSR
jgi:hypothetical protein